MRPSASQERDLIAAGILVALDPEMPAAGAAGYSTPRPDTVYVSRSGLPYLVTRSPLYATPR